MTDVETVKMLSGNQQISDDFVAFQLESVEQLILSYCNLAEMPAGLRHVWLEIAAFKVKANTNGAEVTLGAGAKTASSLSDGNQSVSFSSMGASAIDWNNDEAILSAYASILGRYRKLVVEKSPRGCYLGARRLDGRRHR